MKKLQVLVFTSILIATEIVLTRYCAIQTEIVRVGFGFIPISLAAMLFGPMVGGTAAALSDLLGMLIFPRGPYFPGFTFSALVGGMIYGLFLYQKPKTMPRIILASFLVTVIVDLGLNTLWLSMLTNKAALVLLPPRLLSNTMMFLVKITMIPVVWRRIGLVIVDNYLKRTV